MLNLLNNIPLRHCKTAQASFSFTSVNKVYIKSSIIQYNVTFTKALQYNDTARTSPKRVCQQLMMAG